jgi:hypothetical protein
MAIMDHGKARVELIRKLESIIDEDVPWAYGYYHTLYWLSQPWLLNYRGSEMIANKMKYYRVNKDVKKRYLEVK